MFIVTDGFSNTTTIGVPGYDATKYGAAAPYTEIPTGSLSDLALAYYTNRLRTDLAAGKVPPSSSVAPNADKNPNLHINTYAISLGVRGSLWPTEVDPFETAPVWTAPLADDPSLIDDQWHATINGRGLMYLATNPAETAAGIKAVLDDIVSQRGAQGGVAVSTVNLSRGDNRAYFGTYNPSGWQGDITAHPIDAATGAVDPDSTLWSASAKLTARDWSTRVIATAIGDAGAVLHGRGGWRHRQPRRCIRYGRRRHRLPARRPQQGRHELPHPPIADRCRDQLRTRGRSARKASSTCSRAKACCTRSTPLRIPPAASSGPSCRPRPCPTSARPRPAATCSTPSSTARRPSAPMPAARLLVAGMGAAGNSFYALDVSAPRELTEAAAGGQLPLASSRPAARTAAKVGQALGRPRIVKTSGDSYVVLVTSGYNSTLDGHGRLWMLNASTGAVIHEFDTGVGTLATEAGLAQVSGFHGQRRHGALCLWRRSAAAMCGASTSMARTPRTRWQC